MTKAPLHLARARTVWGLESSAAGAAPASALSGDCDVFQPPGDSHLFGSTLDELVSIFHQLPDGSPMFSRITLAP